ncbi:MAG: hypothetical protein R2932_27030 [Caldilineaceae bacterium]
MSNSEIPSVTPILTLRPFQPTDEDAVRVRINEQLLRADYSTAIDGAALLANLQHSSPPSVYAVRWQRHQCFCVWRAGMLEGLIDVAVGLDSDSYDLPDYSPLGLLRFFLLPVDEQRIPAVAELLLGAAERFWKQHRVAHIKAFHLSTGYPQFQGGLGALPGDWHAHIHVLTNANYQFTERFYALCRPLDQPLEETMPVIGSQLVYLAKTPISTINCIRQTERVGGRR